jgi:hypothetical protein
MGALCRPTSVLDRYMHTYAKESAVWYFHTPSTFSTGVSALSGIPEHSRPVQVIKIAIMEMSVLEDGRRRMCCSASFCISSHCDSGESSDARDLHINEKENKKGHSVTL